MNNSQTLGKQLVQLYADIDKSLLYEIDRVFMNGKGEYDHNDAFGRVFIVGFSTPIPLNGCENIIGIARENANTSSNGTMYLHIQDTTEGKGEHPLSGADYLSPLDDTRGMSNHKLIEVLARLEQE